MKILFLFAFGGGLAIAVYAMLHGVERTRPAGVTRPAPYLNLPAFAAFMVAFGALGYLFVKNSDFSALFTGVFALIAGVLSWFGMSVLMAKWALRPAAHSAHDEAEEIQGQLAVVFNAIGPGEVGSIRYGHPGAMQETPAKSIDSSSLGAGTEVVIDRFESGVAIVENWTSVEKRL